jgi:hypothetical protein
MQPPPRDGYLCLVRAGVLRAPQNARSIRRSIANAVRERVASVPANG